MDISTTYSTCTIIALKITTAADTITTITNLAVRYITTATATAVTTIPAAARTTAPVTTATNTTIPITTAFLHVLIFLLLI
eukprot:11199951-Ditylum_brightwellii.AAC.1